MAEARSDQEPSIEEILASIREIISDDDAPKADAAPEPVAEPVPDITPEPAPVASAPVQEPEDDDILDLSSFAADIKAPEDKKDPLAGIDFDKPKEMTVSFEDPEPEPEPAPAIEDEPVFVPAPEPAPVAASLSSFGAGVLDTESLMTDTAKAATVDSLTRLAQNIAISKAGNGGTLEDIVREMIKPMLRDWLDRNLPPMIERMVERELERMVKQAMDR